MTTIGGGKRKGKAYSAAWNASAYDEDSGGGWDSTATKRDRHTFVRREGWMDGWSTHTKFAQRCCKESNRPELALFRLLHPSIRRLMMLVLRSEEEVGTAVVVVVAGLTRCGWMDGWLRGRRQRRPPSLVGSRRKRIFFANGESQARNAALGYIIIRQQRPTTNDDDDECSKKRYEFQQK